MKKGYFFLVSLSLLLGAASLAGARVFQVNIPGFSFSPAAESIAVGDSIRWTNLDAIYVHTATSTSGPMAFNSGSLSHNQSYVFQFTVAGHYGYHCSIHLFTGTVDVSPGTGVEQGISGAPTSGLAMMQNQPNPFSNKTLIAFQLPKAGPVTLEVYDLLGRRVVSLAQGTLAAGVHEVNWDGRNAQGEGAAPGVYFYRLSAEGKILTHTLILVR
jgi:plastocyanin